MTPSAMPTVRRLLASAPEYLCCVKFTTSLDVDDDDALGGVRVFWQKAPLVQHVLGLMSEMFTVGLPDPLSTQFSSLSPTRPLTHKPSLSGISATLHKRLKKVIGKKKIPIALLQVLENNIPRLIRDPVEMVPQLFTHYRDTYRHRGWSLAKVEQLRALFVELFTPLEGFAWVPLRPTMMETLLEGTSSTPGPDRIPFRFWQLTAAFLAGWHCASIREAGRKNWLFSPPSS